MRESEEKAFRNSLAVQWLGVSAFTAGAQVQYLVPRGMVKEKKKKRKLSKAFSGFQSTVLDDKDLGTPQTPITPWALCKRSAPLESLQHPCYFYPHFPDEKLRPREKTRQ